MSLLGLCNQTATVQRKTVSVGTTGGQVTTWSNAYSGEPCTIQPVNGRTMEVFEKRDMRVDMVVYFANVLDLATDDRIDVGDGRKYLVQWWGDMGGRMRHTKAMVRVVDP